MNRSKIGIIIALLSLVGVVMYYGSNSDNVVETSEDNESSQHVEQTVEEQTNNNTSRFIFIGDTGTGNENQYAVAEAIKNYCNEKQDCKSVFILGDVIYPDGVVGNNDVAFIEKFESPYKNIDLPFYILFGNHDYLGCTDCYLKHGEQSSKWIMPDRYYEVESDDVNFYAMDTEQLDSEQLDWLGDGLQEEDEEVDIVLGHRPILSNEVSKYGENWNGRQELKDTICEDADIYISGHSHILEDAGQVEGCSYIQLVSGGGGAYIRDIQEPFEGDFYHTGYGFLSIDFNEDEATYEFINTNNEVLHSKTIESSKEPED